MSAYYSWNILEMFNILLADIVRLLFMVPIYAIVSLASYIFWNHALPITLLRDSYESFVLYSFFYLLLQYLSPSTEGQKEVFRNLVLKKWIFPLGFIKYRPRDGLYLLQLMKWVRRCKCSLSCSVART